MGGGNVDKGSSALVCAMLTGGLVGLDVNHEQRIRRLVLGSPATVNQRLMAWAAGLWSTRPKIVEASIRGLHGLLGDELRFGPTHKEILCPDSHGGMYFLGWLGVAAAGLRPGASVEVRELGAWAALIVGQMLRLGDLVATPDGDCKGIPGMRAPAGAALGRRSHTGIYREVRGRQGFPLIHRGTGGRKMALKWKANSDPLVDGAAWWAKSLLDSPAGGDLLRGPWSPDAPLPPRLRLPLTVARWDGGTLSWFNDPGLAHRREFLTHGSAAANDTGRPEPIVDWIGIEWGAPAKHRATAGLNWETPRPEPPTGATLTRIPGLLGGL